MTSDEIRTARESLGLTQREFGAMLMSSERTVRAWEAGFRNMPRPTEQLLKLMLETSRSRAIP
jgi:DNA-binding transcriptional regulator YiaG